MPPSPQHRRKDRATTRRADTHAAHDPSEVAISGGVEEKITATIAPALADMGCDIVRVMLQGGGRMTLQVMIERRDGAAVSVDDCAGASRAISVLLDVADPIGGPWTLEVSSPGVNRPLVRPEHFARFAGHDAVIDMHQPVDGRRRFRGRLLGFVDGHAHLRTLHAGAAVEVALPHADIRRARLTARGLPGGDTENGLDDTPEGGAGNSGKDEG